VSFALFGDPSPTHAIAAATSAASQIDRRRGETALSRCGDTAPSIRIPPLAVVGLQLDMRRKLRHVYRILRTSPQLME
jgi:hypothetical protein